ncbi:MULTISPECIES: PLP-dependent aminotransferase family protein [Dethiosulfovibrio]|uniref:PLP-dependent aminotransferase family protein n=2 Tax=Dethiosulfovibrio TaxID=47054 RepID=A0ABS9ENX1_9BACT|nr:MULTISPECIES: PLP-dependent aminotransferase family protein [Dethiosulfovibrio]MCF4114659.1 PLP-dependent aminotransferase family protein [Dethiosulfovibrio russensis]MCF4142882.1 PLP-dependent aminotransferase family protein [Dethiosulfovibrio marinus]MCF4144789.1 PLP-dependent aminotransferase family protein [Dethiosulfovibrio acidaminovorans]
MIEIPLKKSSTVPLYRQMSDHLEKMIKSGAFSPGERLPGSRGFAKSLGVSRMTVMEAFRRLEDLGLIVQRGRSGAYIAGIVGEREKVRDRSSNRWSLAGELPSRSLIPSEELARIAKSVLYRRGGDVLRENPTAGIDELRRALVVHAASRGIPADWQDVTVTSGGRQGLAVSFGALKSAGVSEILMDGLNYPDAWILAMAEGLSVVPFSRPGDPREDMESRSSHTALYLVPSFSNPTGHTMGGSIREQVLALSHAKGMWIVEDDAYGELRYGDSSVPALRAMDDGKRLVYLGSFSQALFPGIRLGYSLVPGGIRGRFLRSLAERGGPASSLVQHVLERFIVSGGLEEALERARLEMACRMRSLCTSLVDSGLGSFSRPQGGIYLWLETPGLSGRDLARLASNRGVEVASGDSFSLNGEAVEAVRLSVSDISLNDIPEAVKVLADAWRGQLSSLK